MLIVAPTRELAVQIHRDAELLGKHAGLRFGVFLGTGYESQRQMLEAGLDAAGTLTPIDYFKQRATPGRRAGRGDRRGHRMFDRFIRDIRYLPGACPSPPSA